MYTCRPASAAQGKLHEGSRSVLFLLRPGTEPRTSHTMNHCWTPIFSDSFKWHHQALESGESLGNTSHPCCSSVQGQQQCAPISLGSQHESSLAPQAPSAITELLQTLPLPQADSHRADPLGVLRDSGMAALSRSPGNQ